MKTAIFLVGGVLVACSLYLSEAATLYRPGLDEDAFDFDSDFKDIPNSSYHAPIVTSLLGWKPVSHSILGNLVLVFLYGIILGYSAKLISDGAELLLDLGLPAGIIGGVVLPLLGAVPDSAMIVFSGMGGTKEEAQQQIDVGMGTLAGSTIMLLTIPWLGSLILGRVDIINGEGKDNTCSPFRLSSLWTQGITVLPDVTRSAIVMLITMLPYFIVQGADWHYGPTKPSKSDKDANPKNYIKDAALVTAILSLILFVLYLVYQVYDNVNAQRKAQKRNEEKRKQELVQRVIKQFILGAGRSSSGLGAFGMSKKPAAASNVDDESGETQPLVPSKENTGNLQKKYFGAWRMSKGTGAAPEEEKPKEKSPERSEESEDEEEAKWKVAIKCALQLIIGVGMVTLFSDPMVDALTDLTDHSHEKGTYMPNNGTYMISNGINLVINAASSHSYNWGSHIPIGTFYVSFVVTPLCSNASELVSSLIFASKKMKVNSSMTYSQLYGAATMNNTLCLGIFAVLVYARDLEWEFSAEVTVIIFIEVFVGAVALISGYAFKHTYYLFVGFIVGAMFFVSIGLVAFLENVLDWK